VSGPLRRDGGSPRITTRVCASIPKCVAPGCPAAMPVRKVRARVLKGDLELWRRLGLTAARRARSPAAPSAVGRTNRGRLAVLPHPFGYGWSVVPKPGDAA
jgi:hypothetical protein